MHPVWQSNMQTFLGVNVSTVSGAVSCIVNGVPVLEEGVAQEPTPANAARHGQIVEREIRR